MKTYPTHRFVLVARALALAAVLLSQVLAAPPAIISHQGRIAVGGMNLDGNGHFKFAFVDAAGTASLWSNDGSSVGGGEPATALALPVNKGHYAVLLGETNPIPATVFGENEDVHLRIWFSLTGAGGSYEQLAPDRRVASAAYALSAASVGDGLITTTPAGGVVIGDPDAGAARFWQEGLASAQLGVSRDLVKVGDYAYVVGDGGLQIFKVTSTSLAARGTHSATLTGASGVAVVGNLAYVLDRSPALAFELQIFDVGDPDNIVPRGTTTVPGGFTESFQGIAVGGSNAYVAFTSGFGGAVRTVDVSDPDAPAVVARGSISVAALALAASGDLLYVGRYRSTFPAANAELRIYNMARPSTPALLDSDGTGLSTPRAIALRGNHAYVVDGLRRLQVFDVRNPSAIVPLGSDGTGLSSPRGIAVEGNTAYVMDISGGIGRLHRFDVSDALDVTPVLPAANISATSSALAAGADGAAYLSDSSAATPVLQIQRLVTARATVDGALAVGGGLVDSAGGAGQSGQILGSTGDGTGWLDLLDNDPTNELQSLSLGGGSLTLSGGGGAVELGSLVAALPPKSVTGAMISAPGNDRVLVSDGTGGAQWMSADQFLLAQGYTPSLPGVVENLVPLEIEGVFDSGSHGEVQIINGPGFSIEDLGGAPGESGLNAEFDIVFDYPASGSGAGDLQAWLSGSPEPRTGSIIVEDGSGMEVFRWNFSEYQLTNIAPGGGNAGKNRYTLSSTLPPDNQMQLQRSVPGWPVNEDRRAGDTKVEIGGVQQGGWAAVVHDPLAKTLTMNFDYNEGGDVFGWAEQIARLTTFNGSRRVVTLIYEQNNGTEIGRNDFFECFPIRYQHFTGFDLHTKGREQIVVSYDFARNADTGSLPLYSPPVVEYQPGEILMEVPYDLATNDMDWEVEGVLLTDEGTPTGDRPVVLSGPGFTIERVPGFDAEGDPDDQSGADFEMPLVVEAGGLDLAALGAWKAQHELGLPTSPDCKNMRVILQSSPGNETFRWNLLSMVPLEITPLASGRSRVTMVHDGPPAGLFVELSFRAGESWGDALQNNPATDTEVVISGVTTVFAGVAVDAAARTITLTYDFGEGGSIFPWAEDIAEGGGTASHGKRAVLVGGATNYFGCFPIAFQHFTGFERDNKAKAKVVLSYDRSTPAS